MFLSRKRMLQWMDANNLDPEWLPHLSSPLYQWNYDFLKSNNRVNLLTAANQIGKSSVAIRKNIWLATESSVHPHFFPASSHNLIKANLFWYFMPDLKTFEDEFDLKWVETWLPRVPHWHPLHKTKYGWEVIKDSRTLRGIVFNSGTRIMFKTYTMSPKNIQSGTVTLVTADEECPELHYKELRARLYASKGTFMSVFTMTLGQPFWLDVMDERLWGTKKEKLPDANKRVVSMYECLEYMEGWRELKTPWTLEQIEFEKSQCPDEETVQVRIYGKPRKISGLTFYSYLRPKTELEDHKFNPKNMVLICVDPGSGQAKSNAHPAGVVILEADAIRNWAVVLSCWRGDRIDTTSNDILKQVQLMAKGLPVTGLIYDYAAADFYITAKRELNKQGIPVIPAKKKKVEGLELVNSYLKAGALKIPSTRPEGVQWWEEQEIEKLHTEMATVVREVPGMKKVYVPNDLTDALRYGCMHISLDLNIVAKVGERPKEQWELTPPKKIGRHLYYPDDFKKGKELPSEEIQYWNEQLGGNNV